MQKRHPPSNDYRVFVLAVPAEKEVRIKAQIVFKHWNKPIAWIVTTFCAVQYSKPTPALYAIEVQPPNIQSYPFSNKVYTLPN